jgi:DNA modification methylase
MLIRDRVKGLKKVLARQLRPNPKNWRRHPDAQANALRGILAELGYCGALLARECDDGSYELIDGHLRAETTPDTKVPVLVLDVTREEADLVLATYDTLGGMAEADKDALEALLSEISPPNDDVQQMLDELLAEATAAADEALVEVVEAPVPEPPDAATTKPGDLWILGEHRLLCGDSSSTADLDRLLAGEAIHLVNMDPPYNVKVEPRSNNAIAAGLSSFAATHHQQLDAARRPGASKPTGKKLRAKDRPLINDFVGDAEFERLLRAWFGNAARVLKPGRGFYIWGGYANVANYPPALAACGLYFSQAIIWHKQHAVLTRKDFMGDHEWCFFGWRWPRLPTHYGHEHRTCFYGWREGAAHPFFGPANVPDVWSIKKVNPQSMVHLTEKPVELAARAMQYSSRPGERVLDLFGGSGSTLIAAEQLSRRAYLMELDALYCDVIVQRWEQLSGRRAEVFHTK